VLQVGRLIIVALIVGVIVLLARGRKCFFFSILFNKSNVFLGLIGCLYFSLDLEKDQKTGSGLNFGYLSLVASPVSFFSIFIEMAP